LIAKIDIQNSYTPHCHLKALSSLNSHYPNPKSAV
jgi:hypothetical protein